MELFTAILSVQSILTVTAVWMFCFVVIAANRAYSIRRRTTMLRKMGFSFAPHHPVFGSLIATKETMDELPADVNPQYLAIAIRRRYPNVGNVFYIDNWPFVAPILVTASPHTARQITQDRSLLKFPAIRNYFRPIGGKYDLITMEGPMWKKWRGVFNPGFGATYLTTLVPEIVDKALVFCKALEERAASDVLFQLKPLTDNFTVDVIGKLVLNVDFDCQKAPHPMINALRRQVQWLSLGTELNLWQRWHPIRPFIHWYNSRIMNAYVNKALEEQFEARARDKDYAYDKSVTDRSIKTYLSDVAGDSEKTKTMDAATKELIVGQIKLFLFSGHDTTSASVCYAFYLLSRSPPDLARIRAEHDQILGHDDDDTHLAPASAAKKISANPHVLNQLPFTLAVIKETLRLFPIASSTRLGTPDVAVESEEGRTYPTDGCLVWSIPHLIQRSPDFWPRPDAFLPERWLVAPGHELYPVKGAWRPFEFGPRNCIGQELALLEMKLVLALVVRRFDFRVVYEEWDRLYPRKGPTCVAGERAYQAANGGPSEGMPCRVRIRG